MRKLNSFVVFILTFAAVLFMTFVMYFATNLESAGVSYIKYFIASIAFSATCGSIVMIMRIEDYGKAQPCILNQPITAVLYDSKVGYVVDMVIIDRPMDVIKAPDCREGIIGRDTNDWGIKTKNYHFFCVQDDGKHIYIERG